MSPQRTTREDQLAMLSRLEWLVLSPERTIVGRRWFAWLSVDRAAFVVARGAV